jgi:hypothetical protein
MSSDDTTQIVGLEPTYSAREAAALLGRSFSWLDQRVRNGDFVLTDGTVLQPLRWLGGTGISPSRCSKILLRVAIGTAGSHSVS